MGRINKTNKSNPVSADEFIIYDSEDTSDDKNITLGQIASFTESQDSTIAGTKIFANGVQFQNGNISFGQYSPLPTSIGSYIASYVSPIYGPRISGYNDSAYEDLSIGSMPINGIPSMKSLANGDCNFGYNVNVAGDATANKFIGDGSELTGSIIELRNIIKSCKLDSNGECDLLSYSGSDVTVQSSSTNPLIYVNPNGTTSTIASQNSLDFSSGYSDGKYSLIQLSDGTVDVTASYTEAKKQPTSPTSGDYYLNTSTIPNKLFKYDSAEWIEKQGVFIGSVNVANNVVTSVEQPVIPVIKPKSVGHTVIETYVNGTSWYRVWSDGWCEQGGTSTVFTTNPISITLLKNFTDTNYSLQFTPHGTNSRGYAITVSVKNANSFSGICGYGTNEGVSQGATGDCKVNWYACGYLASGQY